MPIVGRDASNLTGLGAIAVPVTSDKREGRFLA